MRRVGMSCGLSPHARAFMQLTARAKPGSHNAFRLQAKKANGNVHSIIRLKSTIPAQVATPKAPAPERLPPNMSPFWLKRRDFVVFGHHINSFTLSNLAGHLSFVCLGLGFMSTEQLSLRSYAMTGASCAIAFQYFRREPLWLSITWNTFFVWVNAGMVMLILKENHDAQQQGKSAEEVYEKVFRQSGMRLVDFMKLYAQSETVRLDEGELVTKDGDGKGRVYLVVDGALNVIKGGVIIGTIEAGQFVEEMTFLQYLRDGDEHSKADGVEYAATKDVRVRSTKAKLVSWKFDELRHLLSKKPQMSGAFHNTIARTMGSKFNNTPEPAAVYRGMLRGALFDGAVSDQAKERLMRIRQDLDVDEDLHREELAAVGWSEEEFDQGYPHRMVSKRYEELANEILSDGVVDDNGRARLRALRIAEGVDDLQHVRILRKLGWTLDNYEEGRKETAAIMYAAMSADGIQKRLTKVFVDQLAGVAQGNAGDQGIQAPHSVKAIESPSERNANYPAIGVVPLEAQPSAL